MHVTNYAVNKTNEKFVFNTNANEQSMGNKWTYRALCRQIEQQPSGVERVIALKRNIDDLIIKTLLSVHSKLIHEYRVAFPFGKFSPLPLL